MTAIRAVFDGKAFIPKEPVAASAQTEAWVLVDNPDPAAQQRLDDAVRAYYRGGDDQEDDAWARATANQSRRAWDED